jgi:hypothetical protein
MTSLAKLQLQFQNQILGVDSDVINLIQSTHSLSAKTRVMIYANSYYAKMVDILRDQFPLLKRYMGEQRFTKMAQEYVDKYPSKFYSLRWYGDKIPQFIKQYNQPILVELAKFEWADNILYDAPDNQIIDKNDFAQIPQDKWGNMTFEFQNNLALHKYRYDIPTLWQHLTHQQKLAKTYLNKEMCYVLFWRRNRKTQHKKLSKNDFTILHLALSGATFTALCDQIITFTSLTEFPNVIATTINTWISMGIIKQIKLL